MLAGCSAPSAVFIDGVSHHSIKEGRDNTSPGVGVRNGKFFVDAGAAWYDGKNGYKSHVVPILNAEVKVGVVEAGLAAPDIANVRIVIDNK